MHPINIQLTPIAKNYVHTEPQQTRPETNVTTTPNDGSETLLQTIRSIIDYLFTHIFDSESESYQSEALGWITTTFITNSPHDSESFHSYSYTKPGVQIKIAYGAEEITISGRRQGTDPATSWTVMRNQMNAPVAYKNDFSWMD